MPTFWCLLNQMQETENQKTPKSVCYWCDLLKMKFDKIRNLIELVLWERSFDDLAAESNTEHKWSLLFIATVYIWVLIQIRETLPQFQNVLKLLNYLFDRIWVLVQRKKRLFYSFRKLWNFSIIQTSKTLYYVKGPWTPYPCYVIACSATIISRTLWVTHLKFYIHWDSSYYILHSTFFIDRNLSLTDESNVVVVHRYHQIFVPDFSVVFSVVVSIMGREEFTVLHTV